MDVQGLLQSTKQHQGPLFIFNEKFLVEKMIFLGQTTVITNKIFW